MQYNSWSKINPAFDRPPRLYQWLSEADVDLWESGIALLSNLSSYYVKVALLVSFINNARLNTVQHYHHLHLAFLYNTRLYTL